MIRSKGKEEEDVGIICVIIYDDLALEAWTQKGRRRERGGGREGAMNTIKFKLPSETSSHQLPSKELWTWESCLYRRRLLLFTCSSDNVLESSNRLTSFCCGSLRNKLHWFTSFPFKVLAGKKWSSTMKQTVFISSRFVSRYLTKG